MNNYDTTSFENELMKLEITLSDLQLQQFLTYYELLVDKNKVMNLTSITDFHEVLLKHFIDSISLVRVLNLEQSLSLMDMGTGAGFPGIPLKIVFPNLKVTLSDSLNKRVNFLQEVIDTLNLKEINAVHGRAEDLARNSQYRESYDLCVSRAVANLSTLSEYCLPFVKIGGKFVSYKSGNCLEEVEEAKTAVFLLGGKIMNIDKFDMCGSSRSFVVIEKRGGTPKKYPRKAGTPSKNPIK